MYDWFKESLVYLWGTTDPGVPVLVSARRLRVRRLLIRRVTLVLWFLVAGMLGMAFGVWVVS